MGQTGIPYLHGGPLGRAKFKVQPEDFIVEELLGFEPSGEGEHCLVWVEKRGVDSNEVVSRFADALGVRRRLVSHCGLKDRNAITRQWFSIHLPGESSPEPAAFGSEGVRALRIERHHRKLRRGFHQGNRFAIRLRDADFERGKAEARWAQIARRGVPNLFGPQRFGRGGSNVEKALRLFRGEFKTQNPLLRGLLISAARSQLFNDVVAERLRRGCWDRLLEGEVFGFADNRSLILLDKQRGDEAERFAQSAVEITAPLWGDGDLLSGGEVRELESAIARGQPELVAGLVAVGLRQERRVLRLHPGRPELAWDAEDVVLRFDLPKGSYATSLLREFAELDERRFFTRVESPDQIEATAELARRIWTQHYGDIVGLAQVEYMLAGLQSAEAISSQIDAGVRYYLIGANDGYLAFEPRGETLFLSKIYVDAAMRGSGLGRRAFEFVIGEARALACKRIELTVNRGNGIAIEAYERWGMRCTGEKVADIGGGFVMDDYVYEKEL